jgi:hypothetical protein
LKNGSSGINYDRKKKMKMAKTIVIVPSNVTPDITRKGTNVYRLAKMLADKRRKGAGMTRKQIMEKVDFDPAPYVKLYGCFETVERGRYRYTGKALAELG